MKRKIKTPLSKKAIKSRTAREALITKMTRDNIINSKTGFDTMESYKTTRTNIMFSLVGNEGCKKIIFTSPMAGEGKTTTCINMALTFSQTGARVLIIDADLRRPRIHSYLNFYNSEGISNVLAGFAQLDDVIRSKNGIDCITAGHIPQNPAELLSSKKMEDIMDELSGRYDYIFLDTPPVAVVTDAASMSKIASGVVLVVRQKYTIHNAISTAITALENANAKILGFMLNDAEFKNFTYRRGKYDYYNYNNLNFDEK